MALITLALHLNIVSAEDGVSVTASLPVSVSVSVLVTANFLYV